jgi:hypothetical protein
MMRWQFWSVLLAIKITYYCFILIMKMNNHSYKRRVFGEVWSYKANNQSRLLGFGLMC